MSEVTRAEHLAWCKERALAYLPDDTQQAATSMFSDLGKHPETVGHIGIELGMMEMMGGHLDSPGACRRLIEGFN